MMVCLRLAAITASIVMMSACTSTSTRLAVASATPDAAVAKPACVTPTASRIPRNPGDCDGFGRSYSKSDIENTGATTAGGALRLLDPGLTIGP